MFWFVELEEQLQVNNPKHVNQERIAIKFWLRSYSKYLAFGPRKNYTDQKANTIMQIKLISFHKKWSLVIKLFQTLFSFTEKSRVLARLVLKQMQAFSDYLWRGNLIVIYCDLLGKGWFPNYTHALLLETLRCLCAIN